MSAAPKRMNVAMIGHGFMGAAHSQGWRTAPRVFDLPVEPRMHVIVGRDEEGTRASAKKYGWDQSSTDWRKVVESDDVDLVDICSSGDTHAEIAIAALEAGKHVLCEKPLANTVDEAVRMATAARAAARSGVFAMLGFSYRRVPAVQLAQSLVADGRLGELHHVRAQYLQDWLTDPDSPMSWRLDKTLAGSGALGDIGAHAIDAVQFVTGQNVDAVSGILKTLVSERPITAGSPERGHVTVDDAALFSARLSGGAIASFEATRFATGRKNALRLEMHGSRGALAFDLERLNELEFFDKTDPVQIQGFRRIVVTEPEHPYLNAWWPPGHSIGYENLFSHQVRDLIVDISTGSQPTPSFDDGLQVQRVLAAVEQSSENDSSWTSTDSNNEGRTQ